jgi:hypothetical protein
MAKSRIFRRRRIHLERLEATRKRLLRKANDPSDLDDPNWVRVWQRNVEARIVQKERSLEHRATQRKHSVRTIRRAVLDQI